MFCMSHTDINTYKVLYIKVKLTVASSSVKDKHVINIMAVISDEATKHYCKIQPATEPSDEQFYQNVINTRQFTLANITQL